MGARKTKDKLFLIDLYRKDRIYQRSPGVSKCLKYIDDDLTMEASKIILSRITKKEWNELSRTIWRMDYETLSLVVTPNNWEILWVWLLYQFKNHTDYIKDNKWYIKTHPKIFKTPQDYTEYLLTMRNNFLNTKCKNIPSHLYFRNDLTLLDNMLSG